MTDEEIGFLDLTQKSLTLSRPSGEPLSDREKAVGLRTLWSVYGSDRSKCTGLCDVDEAARQLRNAGMTPETLILVWHVSYMDLTLLRELLESGGYNNILPPNDNCVRMVPQYRNGLPTSPTRKRFPAKLDVLFPLLFAGHSLVGQNHRALPGRAAASADDVIIGGTTEATPPQTRQAPRNSLLRVRLHLPSYKSGSEAESLLIVLQSQ